MRNHFAKMINLISPNFQDIESLFQMSDYYKVQILIQMFVQLLSVGLLQRTMITIWK